MNEQKKDSFKSHSTDRAAAGCLTGRSAARRFFTITIRTVCAILIIRRTPSIFYVLPLELRAYVLGILLHNNT